MAFDSSKKRDILIVGGGIIGTTTAYFLTRHPLYNPAIHNIILLEGTSIASAASGKAGGLLALWAYPSCIVPLSYKLHAELAREHDGEKRWGYRALSCGSIRAQSGSMRGSGKTTAEQKATDEKEWNRLPKTDMRTSPVKNLPRDLDWLDNACIKGYDEMGTPSTTAQVHPFLFTNAMADLAQEKGVKIIHGHVTALDYFEGKIKGLTYDDRSTKHIHTLPATDVILAAGPWTKNLFPDIPLEAMRAHSVVVKADVSAFALFTEIEPEAPQQQKGKGKAQRGKIVTPEMYARPDGTVYVCGEGDTAVPLPRSSDLVICDESRAQEVLDYVGSISPVLRDGAVLVKQACYLPSVVGGGGPLIGRTGVDGLFIATGHTCWGIQNSCATGKLMSEFVFEGEAKSADIRSLDPLRFL